MQAIQITGMYKKTVEKSTFASIPTVTCYAS